VVTGLDLLEARGLKPPCELGPAWTWDAFADYAWKHDVAPQPATLRARSNRELFAVGLLLAAAALNVGAALVRRRAGPLADPRRSGDQGGAVA
jgi:hypothetical protein